jgi:hypothetical protein
MTRLTARPVLRRSGSARAPKCFWVGDVRVQATRALSKTEMVSFKAMAAAVRAQLVAEAEAKKSGK